MGMGPFRFSDTPSPSRSSTPEPKFKLPNPNPYRFKILQSLEIGKYLICKVHYPDCTTFEGIKVMVYQNVTKEWLKQAKVLDPHFFDDPKAPIARFRGNQKGWALALYMVSSLVMEENQ